MVALTTLKDVKVETLIGSALWDQRYSFIFISFSFFKQKISAWSNVTENLLMYGNRKIDVMQFKICWCKVTELFLI